jgi:hypothetical protein
LLGLSRFDPLPGAPTFHGFNPIAPPIVSYSYPPSSLYERFAKAPSSIPQHAAQSATADAQFSCPRDLHVQAKIVVSTFTALLMELLNRSEGNKNGRRKREHQSKVEIQSLGGLVQEASKWLKRPGARVGPQVERGPKPALKTVVFCHFFKGRETLMDS